MFGRHDSDYVRASTKSVANCSAMFMSISDKPFQIALSLLGVELFNCIPEHGSRHYVVMFFQEILFSFLIPFAYLAKHPSCRFMNEIVFVRKQLLC